MSSPLTVKRRKLNDISNSLSKPFVSPLKAAKSDPGSLPKAPNGNHTVYRPSTLAHTITAVTPTRISGTESKPTTVTPSRPIYTRTSTSYSSNRLSKDPAEVAAQKAITSLELQIRNIRNEIDSLTQAQSLSASSRDAELEDLAVKWKSTAQSAAEEVFGTVKERVCRMGGAQAWRESEQKKFDRIHGLGEFAEKNPQAAEDDDADCEFDSQGEELPEEEAEWRKSERRRLRKEREEAMDHEVGEDDAGAGRSMEKRDMPWQEAGNDDDVRACIDTSMWSID